MVRLCGAGVPDGWYTTSGEIRGSSDESVAQSSLDEGLANSVRYPAQIQNEMVVGPVGFEPTRDGLKVRCSAS